MADTAKPNEDRAPDPKVAESRFSRLRKKKDMPGGLWLKCESCGKTIYRKELEEKSRVCPSCDFHFTLPGAERIRLTLDEGSWDERYADLETIDRLQFEDKVPYLEKIRRTVERTGQKEALLCGLGAVEGHPVVIAVLDFTFLGGSMGEVVGEKIALSAELARDLKRPLLIFTSSGGARMHEGVISLMQMAKTCSALAEFSDAGGFSVCTMTHPTTGGVTASFASICDVTLAEPGALIGFAGPRVIASTIKQELPEGFQRSEFLVEKGQVDAIVHRYDLRATLSRLIDYSRGARVSGDDPQVDVERPPRTEGPLASSGESPGESGGESGGESTIESGGESTIESGGESGGESERETGSDTESSDRGPADNGAVPGSHDELASARESERDAD